MLKSLQALAALAAAGTAAMPNLMQQRESAPKLPSYPRKTRPKQGKANCLRGYYNRYSNAMTEMNVHQRFAHPFSETKRRLLPQYR